MYYDKELSIKSQNNISRWKNWWDYSKLII